MASDPVVELVLRQFWMCPRCGSYLTPNEIHCPCELEADPYE